MRTVRGPTERGGGYSRAGPTWEALNVQGSEPSWGHRRGRVASLARPSLVPPGSSASCSVTGIPRAVCPSLLRPPPALGGAPRHKALPPEPAGSTTPGQLGTPGWPPRPLCLRGSRWGGAGLPLSTSSLCEEGHRAHGGRNRLSSGSFGELVRPCASWTI